LVHPFDRMLAAQAQVEGMSLISADGVFRELGVNVIF
jgi:PIN domain nuclease of toxin-antitoxin system